MAGNTQPRRIVVRRAGYDMPAASGRQLSSLQSGTLANSKEVSEYSYYDRTAIVSDVVRLFQSAVGQNSKTLADTNMQVAGQIPQGQKLTIEEIKVIFESGATNLSESQVSDLIKWISNTVLEFQVGPSKILLQSCLSEILGNPWLIGVQPVTAGNNFTNFNGQFSGRLSLRRAPIELGSTIPFEVRLQSYGAPNIEYIDEGAIKVRVCLKGIREYLH